MLYGPKPFRIPLELRRFLKALAPAGFTQPGYLAEALTLCPEATRSPYSLSFHKLQGAPNQRVENQIRAEVRPFRVRPGRWPATSCGLQSKWVPADFPLNAAWLD